MVSLRELNQRSGRIVRLVAETGRAVTITDHGRPLARPLQGFHLSRLSSRRACIHLVDRAQRNAFGA